MPPFVNDGTGPTLDNTLGALYLGVVASAVLYGVTSLQAYWYYHWYYRRDSLLHKVAVGLLWALDTAHLFLIGHGVYHYAIDGFGNVFGLLEVVWSFKLQITLNVIVVLIVQSLYTYRVWLLGGYHNGILSYLVVLVVGGGFAIGIVLAFKVYTIPTFPQLQSIGWAIEASLAVATGIDFVIAGAMCYYLKKSKGSQSRLNSKISTMMQFVLSSGFLTSACSTSALIAFVVLPHTLVFLGIEALLTKLYINSFLAMLNARERTRAEQEVSCDSIRLPSFGKVPTMPSPIIETTSNRDLKLTVSQSEYSSDDHHGW